MILVIFPLIGLIEDQVKEGQPLALTCASLQDVNDIFSDDPVPQRLFASAEKAYVNLRQRSRFVCLVYSLRIRSNIFFGLLFSYYKTAEKRSKWLLI